MAAKGATEELKEQEETVKELTESLKAAARELSWRTVKSSTSQAKSLHQKSVRKKFLLPPPTTSFIASMSLTKTRNLTTFASYELAVSKSFSARS